MSSFQLVRAAALRSVAIRVFFARQSQALDRAAHRGPADRNRTGHTQLVQGGIRRRLHLLGDHLFLLRVRWRGRPDGCPGASDSVVACWRRHRVSDSRLTPKIRATSVTDLPVATAAITCSRRSTEYARGMVHGGASVTPWQPLWTLLKFDGDGL